MAVTDPIADMLTRIRNGHHGLHREVAIPKSKLKLAIANILKEEGYVNDVKDNGSDIVITLKYTSGKPTISGLRKISKPGRRVYVGAQEIPRVQNGLGICIMSTSHGVLEGGIAKEKNVGGELVCEIW